MLTYQDNFKARLVIYAVDVLLNTRYQSWNAHFAIGLLIADLAQLGILNWYQTKRYSSFLTVLILSLVTYITHYIPMAYNPSGSIKWYFRNKFDLWFHPYLVQPDGKPGDFSKFYSPDLGTFIWSTVFLLAVEVTPLFQRFFASSVFHYFGRISFMLYLVHSYLIHDVGKWLIEYFGDDIWFKRFEIIILMCAYLIAISEFLTRIVDLPSLKLVRFLERIILVEPWSIGAILDWLRGLFKKLKGLIWRAGALIERNLKAQNSYIGVPKHDNETV